MVPPAGPTPAPPLRRSQRLRREPERYIPGAYPAQHPDHQPDNIRLWAFAVTHAAWLYNHLPNRTLGWRSPMEVFTGRRSDHRELMRTHVWGCPAFVLNPKLQDGKKIPKFNRWARLGGSFLGLAKNILPWSVWYGICPPTMQAPNSTWS